MALPFVYHAPYPLHLLVIVLIWSFMYTSWSVMGRFGLVSLGHGGFMGIGAYVTALLWNHFHLTPWLGIPIAMLRRRGRRAGDRVALLPLPHRRPLFRPGDAGAQRHRAAGDHRDARYHRRFTRLHAAALQRRQFDLSRCSSPTRSTWYLIALGVWGVGLFIRYRVDRSMLRYALEAIAEDEDAAAAAGVHVTWEKLKITLLSAVMTAFAGALYCQYQMFISPDTVSGISVSLQMVFAAVVGGIYVLLGPTVGAFITILLAEVLRIGFGTGAVGWDNIIYGSLLVVFIIFLPQGLVGTLQAKFVRVRAA